jgi:hypothetical protein
MQEQLVAVHLSGIIDMDYLKKCDATNCKVLVGFLVYLSTEMNDHKNGNFVIPGFEITF